MSRQDKATTERHAKLLREMLKRPENKLCGDCKRNDPRWASWNLGIFVCIRCSGVHRSMGTHISKVKSVDLDTWTPEQMENIQKWGNHRANLYWEAHLKPGHVPPDHKVESFIRSKYESKRWAREGPLPVDPSVLEDGGHPEARAVVTPPPANLTPKSIPPLTPPVPPLSPPRQTQSHQLLSTRLPPVFAGPPGAVQQPQPPPSNINNQPSIQNDLFSLDFHPPVPVQNVTPKKDPKQDILSLFSQAPNPAPQQVFSPFNQMNTQPVPPFGSNPLSFPGAQNPSAFHNPTFPGQSLPSNQMMGGSNPNSLWGQNPQWGAAPVQQAVPASSGVWGQPTQATPAPSAPFDTQGIWGSPPASNGGVDLFGTTTSAPKKDDTPFGDIWGSMR